MKNKTAKLISILLQNSDISTYRFVEIRLDDRLLGFHQWADGRLCEGAFKIEQTSTGETLWVALIDWKTSGNFYVVIFTESIKEVIAEIHRTVGGDSFLNWCYSPKKRDGQNDQRLAYFKGIAGSPDVTVQVPGALSNTESFLDELFDLAEYRVKADNLDSARPVPRAGFFEGKLQEHRHKKRERSRALIEQAKSLEMAKHGYLKCACCRFDFSDTYGEVGEGFIEAHHIKPVSTLDIEGEETRVEDLALVCSNCHRMLHRKRPWLTMDQLGQLLQKHSACRN